MSHLAAISSGRKAPLRSPGEPPSPSRYELLIKIGSGGTASVYVGRVTGSAGFSRLVAIKRAHPHLIDDADAQRMLVTEARLASRINHANVVAVQDVERTPEELLLVMDYVEGASLAELLEVGAERGISMPARIAVRIALDACAGLSAVHELEGDDGQPIGFLHRDVSPHNILVGVDGTTRITDFGLARHLSMDPALATGCLKGKLAYLAPEVIDHLAFSVESDIFAMGVVTWEALAKRRLFRGHTDADTVRKVGRIEAPRLSRVAPELGPQLDNVVAKALEKAAKRRYGAVRELASALEGVASRHELIATSAEVSSYVRSVVGEALRQRRELIRSLDGAGAAIEAPATRQTLSIIYPREAPINDVGPLPEAESPSRRRRPSLSALLASAAMPGVAALLIGLGGWSFSNAMPSASMAVVTAAPTILIPVVAPPPTAPIEIEIASKPSSIVPVPSLSPRRAAPPQPVRAPAVTRPTKPRTAPNPYL